MLIALHADDAVVGRRELLVADLLVALVALETFRVPLSSFVLEFLHSCKKSCRCRAIHREDFDLV